ncbi:DedA family protein [Ruminiclostridium herbifermentans]|uniref:DedA family protein n=1 Tax=Ruminiclostridium herbifermentans TaxID=2488810 RepID=A0A4U7JH02_9FIRM|nr:DedA family protein [Ruminiclostridium herbifermentans]QNU65950.1 DedA family protein [Ruminiclostridium herbifermentans]
MDTLVQYAVKFIDLVLHMDEHLPQIINDFGIWTYLILFLVIFCETGLVVTPFLPGDSLIFLLGALAKAGDINFPAIIAVLMLAAILGDSCNYEIGKFFGAKLFKNENSKIFKKEYLDRTHEFYEKYGGKTIIIARFVPIIRTFAPFVAGMGSMNYSKFISYNVVGGIGWVAIFSFGGFFFGAIPWVQNNFFIVAIVIILISLMPAVITLLKNKMSNSTK